MSAIRNCLACLLVIALSEWAAGCGGPAGKEKSKNLPPPTTQDHAKPEAAKPEPAATSKAETPEGLAELSAEDRAAAERQKVCPVSGELLGAMGKPYKITVKGRTVFLCCQGCEAAIQKDPDKYLDKLPK